MAEQWVFEYWKPQTGRVNDLIREFQAVIEHARTQYLDIPCLYLLKEDKDVEDPEILTISNFRNEELYKGYLESPEYRNLVAACKKDSLLQYKPRTEIVDVGTGFAYRKDQGEVSDPFVVLGSIRYEPGTRDEGVKHWKDVVSFVEKVEKDALTYCFLKSREDENILFSFERYKSQQFFQEAHVPSDTIQVNIKRQKNIRTRGGLSHRWWKEVGNSRLLARGDQH